MKIDYPEITKEDIKDGDTILTQWETASGYTTYQEFVVKSPEEFGHLEGMRYYLIERPKPKLPEEPGTMILAKRVRGVEFPEGILLWRNKAKATGYNAVYWISHEQVADMGQYGRPRYYDRHPVTKIEDWVLAKVVPA